jgi:hypothetical protein
MQVDSLAIASEVAGTTASRPLSRQPKRFLLDRRFREGKRVQELVDVYTAALGGRAAVDAVKATKVLSAAMARALYEATAGARLRGDDVSYEDIVRLANQADRAERALGLPAAAAASAGSSGSPSPFGALLAEMSARGGAGAGARESTDAAGTETAAPETHAIGLPNESDAAGSIQPAVAGEPASAADSDTAVSAGSPVLSGGGDHG